LLACSPPSIAPGLPHRQTDRHTARSRFVIYKVFCPYHYYMVHPKNPAKLNTMSNWHPYGFIQWKIYKWSTRQAQITYVAAPAVQLDYGFAP
jgi:alpha-D-ribose 1-methylphosphonate 5-phosphate C-P lyase